jgi:hypothetical protein
MRRRLAALAALVGGSVRAVRRAVLLGVAVTVAAPVFSAPADIARGLAWLQAQVQAPGQLAIESKTASQQQARCETASTLLKLSGSSSQVAALVAALEERAADAATESLACWQQLRQQLGQAILLGDLEALRLNQQGYAPSVGFGVAGAIDTGWALAAQLQNLTTSDKATALAWLQSVQGGDGSFAVAGAPDLLTSAVIARALNIEASRTSLAATLAASAANYLLAKRNAQGNWASDLATTAIVFEAVAPYTSGNAAIASNVNLYLLSQQQADGSWASDPYVTAVALRALALTAATPLNPTQAGLKVVFIDERSALPLSGVTVQGSGASSFSATSNSSGVVQVTGVVPGSYQFTASLSSYATINFSITLSAGQISGLGTLQFLPSGSAPVITGIVKDQSTGAVIAGATITATIPDGTAFSGTTGADGRYRMTNVALVALETDRRVSVRASKAGYADATGVVSAYNGQVSDFSPALAAAASGLCNVSGTIVNALTLQPLAGVSVKATAGSSIFPATTDAAGKYNVAVSPNAVPNFRALTTLQTTLSGFDSVSATTSLICPTNKSTTVDFSPKLYPAGQSPANANTAGVHGVLIDAATSQPIAGGQITGTPNVGAAKTTVSAVDGSFTLAGLTGSRVDVAILASGYEAPPLSYSLTPLQTLEIAQVRLRVFAASQLLSDLKVTAVRRGTVQADPQTLGAQGAIDVDIKNTGTAAAPAGVSVYAFTDLNTNKLFDASSEPVFGQATIGSSLAPGQTTTVQITVSGVLPFRDAPISAVIDPANAIAEISKSNNVGSTADQSLVSFAGFNPQQVSVKWIWNGNGCTDTTSGSSVCSPNVMMTPAVGPLHDTNGDGKIDDKDTPRVVFTTFTGTKYDVADTVLRVADGTTGALIWSNTLGTSSLHAQTGIALADLDGDGIPEIVGVKFKGGAVAVDSQTGNIKWQTPDGTKTGAISVADIDGDGRPEVLVGNTVYNWNGTPKFVLSGCGGNSTSVAMKFLTASTGQQILCGSSAYSSTGKLLWGGPAAGSAAWPAAPASFDHGLSAGFAWVFNGTVYMLDSQGNVLWTTSTGGGVGGPPMIADLDGDGIPEIVVSATNRTTAFRADGSVLWAKTTSDPSQGTTSTAFDFAGDGHMYVIYRDTATLHVFDGPTGNEVYTRPSNSFTGSEGPVIADIDGDGHADLIVPGDSSQVTAPSQQGIYVYQGTGNTWAPTRKVWNQYKYSITNINDDLSVPRDPTPVWQSYNRFLSNTRTGGDPRAIPDLTVGYLRVADGGGSGSTLTVRVGNAGGYKFAAGAKFALYKVEPVLTTPAITALKGTAVLDQELQPGQWQDLTFTVAGSLADLSASGMIWIVGDDDGQGLHALQDFDRGNNTIMGNLGAIPTSVRIAVSTDKPLYTDADIAVFVASLTNGGSFAQQVQARFTVVDNAGAQVLALPSAASVTPGANTSVQIAWPASGVLSGSYRLLAELVSADGVVYASSTAFFAVQTSAQQPSSTRILTDRVSYSTAQLVQITDAAVNLTSNTLLESLQAVTTVTNATSQSVFAKAETVDQIAPGGQRQYSYSIAAGTLSPGSYQATIKLLNAQGMVLSQSTANFSVVGSDASGIGVIGQLQATPSVALIGQPVALRLAATNNGNTRLANVPLTVRIIEPASGTVVGSYSQSVNDWPQGAAQNVLWNWTALGLDGQTVVAAASASIAGRDIPLAQANVRLVGVPQLSAAPAQLDFPVIYIGETGAAQSIALASVGSTTATSVTLALTGAHASQFVIPQGGCTEQASLPIGATCTFSISYQPTQVAPHSAELRVSYANESADIVIALTGQAKPVIFTGSVGTDVHEVEAGATVGLNYSVSNPATGTSQLAGSLSVLDQGSQSLASWPLILGVSGLASYAGNQSYATPTQAQTLTVALSQQVGIASVVLATTTFAVTDLPVPLDVAAGLNGQARILVLVSCPPGLGKDEDAACVAQRSQAIASYLTGLGLMNKVVSTAAEFTAQMRCGSYNTYWLSGGAIKLDEQTVGELREAVYRGEALWMDGVHDSRNQLLHPAAGVKEIGKLATANQSAVLAEADLYGAGSLPTLGQPTRFELAGGQAQALFTQVPGEQTPVPAVVANQYGHGTSLLYAFDLAAMLTADVGQASAQLSNFVVASASYAASASPTLTIGDLTVLGTSVTNQGTRTVSLRVQASLPAGLTSTAAATAAQLSTQSDGSIQATWNFSLAGGATQDISWQVRALQAGSYRVPVSVYSLPPTGSTAAPKLRQSASIAAQVRDAASLLQQALAQVTALQPTASADKNARTKALDAVIQAVSLHNQGSHEAAIVQWLAAADALISITSADTAAARSAVSLAMEASHDMVCVQRCGSAACQ